jgi:hypothetical protein
MKTKEQIASQFKRHKKITQDGLAPQYRNTEDCQAFYAGDFMDYWIGAQTQDQFGVKKRSMVQINKVKPYVNAVKGFMAQNRRIPKYSARITGDKMQQMYSDYMNGMATYCRARTYADQKETKQDGEMLINGYGAIETAMTYTAGQATTDPNGQIVKGNLDPRTVGWDPFAKETNLLDARWEFYHQIYDIEDALDLYSDASEEDFESASDEDSEQSEYKFYSRGGKYNKIKESAVEWSDSKREKVKVYFYQWYDFETFWRCENPAFKVTDPRAVALIMANLEAIEQEFKKDGNDQFAFDPKSHILNMDEKTKKAMLKAMPKLKLYEYKRKVFYSAVISKDHVFTAHRSICQRGFSVKFKTGDYDSKNKIWVGMVNSMKEPTLYYNKALTELMYIIGCNSKGGVLVEEDAVDDIQKFEQQWSKTDAVIIVEPGAISGPAPKIRAKKEPYSVTGYEEIVKTVGADIQDSVGFDKTFLGSAESKNETGILQKRRIKQVISQLACYFDAITLYQYEDAYLTQDYMYVYAENNDGSLFSISGQDGKLQFLKIARNKLVAEYDVLIVEAPTSPEDKQEYATILTSMAEKLAQFDPATAKLVLAISIKYLPLEDTDQQTIMQALMPKQGQTDPAMVQKMQQQLQQLMSQATQTELGEKQSKTNLNNAKARLEVARIPEVASTILKNKAQATHDLHEGLMDEAMTHHEITSPKTEVTL